MPMFKVLLIGDTATGKTSIIKSFEGKTPIAEHNVTVIPQMVVEKVRNVTMAIWDTAGSEDWAAMNASVYHGTQAIIFVSSFDKRSSLDNISSVWEANLESHLSPDDYVRVLVVNKSDLQGDECQFDRTQAKAAVGTLTRDCDVIFCSALKNKNIMAIFEKIAELLEKKFAQSKKPASVEPTEAKSQEKEGCC